VVAGDRVLLGRLRMAELNGDPDATAESVMGPGPESAPDRIRTCDLWLRRRDQGVEEQPPGQCRLF
jgi:hypothetical protein